LARVFGLNGRYWPPIWDGGFGSFKVEKKGYISLTKRGGGSYWRYWGLKAPISLWGRGY